MATGSQPLRTSWLGRLERFGVTELWRAAAAVRLKRRHLAEFSNDPTPEGNEPGAEPVDQREMLAAMMSVLSERDQAEEALRESRQRYDLAARTSNDGLWDWNLQSNQIDLSPRWLAMLGYSAGDAGNRPEEWLDRIHENDRATVRKLISTHLEGQSEEFESEHRVLHRDGGYRWVRSRGIAVRGPDGQPLRLVGSQTDITARKQAQKRLADAAIHDSLTGLSNRTHFMTRLRQACGHATARSGEVFAVLVLNLDRFNVVNETLGHAAGDEMLATVAQRLQTCMRPSDIIGRFGGDEFAILLDGLNEATQATRVAERIQSKVAAPFRIGSEEVFTTVSIGVAVGSGKRAKADLLLRGAESAMRRAKTLGAARYELFDPATGSANGHLLHVEAGLRKAADEEFVLHYQPIASAANGTVSGCEALLRWEHPERGFLLPSQFLPVAEETGLITSITEWLLSTVCSQAKAWQQETGRAIRVGVNISARQFNDDNLCELVQHALAHSELDPRLLQLELTESSLIENAAAATEPLMKIAALGVRISLDDFGTGYSSLMHIRRFPISTLKIDQCFVRGIATDPEDAAIASGLISLAHGLKLNVVAEGVETAEQIRYLRAKRCDEIQGHIISKPVAPAAFLDLLQRPKAFSGWLNSVRGRGSNARKARKT